MENIATIKNLRENMQDYIQKIRDGQSFIVFKRSEPVFKISPVDDEGQWETIIDFTKIQKGGVDLEEILKRL